MPINKDNYVRTCNWKEFYKCVTSAAEGHLALCTSSEFADMKGETELLLLKDIEHFKKKNTHEKQPYIR